MNLRSARTLSKKLVYATLPGHLSTYLECKRSRNHQVRYLAENGILDINRKYIDRFGLMVRDGPFAGLRYPVECAVNRHVAPRLIGFYERCLHSTILSLNQIPYERVLDIGCAEGFYAVSLALRYPKARVYAFDADPRELALCRRMAEANNARNIQYRNFCDLATLAELTRRRRCLVLSDCEGFEDKLFSAEGIEAISASDLLIELHEDHSPGVTQRLVERLDTTHEIQLLQNDPVPPEEIPELAEALGDRDGALCLNEFRDPHQQWMCAYAKNELIPRA